MELFRVWGSILLNDSEARRGLENVDRQAEGTGTRLGGLGKIGGLMGKAIVAGTVAAVGGLAVLGGVIGKTGLAYNSMVENSKVAWETLLGSQQKAGEMLNKIANFAKSTQFETTQVDTMAKYMHNAGLEGQALFDELTKVADVSGAFNIPAAEAQELARQMSQVRQAGVAYTEDLNVLQDRGVPIYKAISGQLGVTVADVRKMASEGKISSDIYLKAFDNIANGVKGSSEKQSKTFTGMLSTLKDNLSIISGELTKGAFEKLKSTLSMVMPVIDRFSTILKDKGLKAALTEMFPPAVSNVINKVADGFNFTAKAIDAFYNAFMSVFYDTGEVPDVLAKIGIGPEKAAQIESFFKGAIQTFKTAKDGIISVVGGIGDYISNLIATWKNLFSGDNNLGSSFIKIFNVIKSIALPILQDVVSFIQQKIAQIKQFWDENGAQITQAIKNVWSGIATVLQFIAPVILFIIGTLWETVKGVINGALNIIIGLIKIFSGLFTGDWSKMWEGIKQLFSGAIEFIWNWINLMMFGRILSGIKGFVTGGLESFRGFWTKAVEFFKGMSDGVQSTVSKMYSGVSSLFQKIVDAGRSIFGKIKDVITSPIESAKDLVLGFLDKIKSAFRNLGVKIPLPHFKTSNFSMNPADWVKNGLPKISVDWYAKGTNFAPGGYAVVGEHGPELVQLPRGSKVNTANETEKMMGNTFNFERMLDGATFIIREEADVKKVAKELYEYIRGSGKGLMI